MKKNYPTLVDFTKWMTELKKFKDLQSKVNDVLKGYDTESMFYGGFPEDLIVNLIKKLMDDKDDWLVWWIYEDNWGTKNMKCFDKNKKELKTKTLTDIYNIITK